MNVCSDDSAFFQSNYQFLFDDKSFGNQTNQEFLKAENNKLVKSNHSYQPHFRGKIYPVPVLPEG